MSEVTKSVTTKVGIDVNDFMKGMKEINKELKTTEKTAKEVEKGLSIKFDERRFTQAQKQVQAALKLTEDKAESLREELKYLEEHGAVNTVGYGKVQAELEKTTNQALKLNEQLERLDNIKFEQAGKTFRDFGNKIEEAGRKTAGFSVAASAGILGIKKLAENARTTADDIATNATKYDMATESIQKWEYIGMQSDVSAEALYKSAQKIRSAFGEQLTGNLTAAGKVLEKLQLSYKDFDTNEEAFEATIKALSGIEDKALQAAYANDLFGKRFAADVIPLLQTGTDSIQEYIDEFEAVGYLSDEQVQSLAGLDNVLNKVNARYEQAKLELGEALIPMYEQMFDILETKVVPVIEKLADWFSRLSDGQQNTILIIMALLAVLSPMLVVFGKLSYGVGALIQLFHKLNKATLATAGGFMALGGALVMGLNLIADWQHMSTIEKVLNGLAIAALAAAAAVTVFHASWSMGLAVGAIAAGVTAGIAAINSAKKKIIGDQGDEPNYSYNSSTPTYEIPKYNESAPVTSNTANYTDNSTITVNIEKNDYMDEQDIINAVNKGLKSARQSRI